MYGGQHQNSHHHQQHGQHHNNSLGYQDQNYLPNNYDNNYYDPYAQNPEPYHQEQPVQGYDNYQGDPKPQTNYYDNTPLVSQESTKDKAINWLVYLIPLLFAIFNIILCGMLFFGQGRTNTPPKVDQSVLQFVKSNLQAQPLQPFTTAVAGTACPAGSTMKTIGDFEGIDRGCVCSDGSTTSIALCPFKSSCKYVGKMDKINFQQINKKVYCGTNVKSTYVGSAGVSSCASGSLSCSGLFCTAGTTCGVTTPPATTAAAPQPFTYVNTAQPIVQLFVTPTAYVCFNPTLLPQFGSKLNFPLNSQQAKGCDTYGDVTSYSQIIDTELYGKFLASNDGAESKLTAVPYYSNFLSATDNVNFIGVSRIKTQDNEACNKIDPTQMFNTIDQADSTRTVALIGACIVFFLSLIILIAAPVFYLVRAKVIHGHDMSKFPHTKFLYVFFFIACFIIFALSATWLYKNNGASGLTNVHNQMKSYSDNKCFTDAGPQKAITNVFNFTTNALGQMGSLVPTVFYGDIAFAVIGLLLLLVQHLGLHENFCTDPWDITHLHVVGQ